MPEETKETGEQESRAISSFGEITVTKDKDSQGINQKLSKLAEGYGLQDMRDVVASVLKLGENTELKEVIGPGGQRAFRPQLNIKVSLGNVNEMSKQLTAGMILCWALFNNDNFQVHWQSRFEQEGIFGPTWEHGHYVFRRGTTPQGTYMEMMNIYSDKLDQVQKWHQLQILKISNLLDKLGKGKK